MSVERALAFLEHVQGDEALQMEIAALRGAQALDQLREIADAAGYVFSEADYRAAVVECAAGELSEEALDEVIDELGMKKQ